MHQIQHPKGGHAEPPLPPNPTSTYCPNVVKARDALEGEEWQVLGDLPRLLAVLLVLVADLFGRKRHFGARRGQRGMMIPFQSIGDSFRDQEGQRGVLSLKGRSDSWRNVAQ